MISRNTLYIELSIWVTWWIVTLILTVYFLEMQQVCWYAGSFRLLHEIEKKKNDLLKHIKSCHVYTTAECEKYVLRKQKNSLK